MSGLAAGRLSSSCSSDTEDTEASEASRPIRGHVNNLDQSEASPVSNLYEAVRTPTRQGSIFG